VGCLRLRNRTRTLVHRLVEVCVRKIGRCRPVFFVRSISTAQRWSLCEKIHLAGCLCSPCFCRVWRRGHHGFSRASSRSESSRSANEYLDTAQWALLVLHQRGSQMCHQPGESIRLSVFMRRCGRGSSSLCHQSGRHHSLLAGFRPRAGAVALTSLSIKRRTTALPWRRAPSWGCNRLPGRCRSSTHVPFSTSGWQQ
jgi:hypothetical protein